MKKFDDKLAEWFRKYLLYEGPDTFFKLTFSLIGIILFFCVWIMLKLVRFILAEILESLVEMVCCFFEWEFVNYLHPENRPLYSNFLRDCSEGGWLLYRGPFGLTRVKRSACR